MALYLVDGTFEIFRCFHAADRVQNDDGQEVGASRAFFHTIASLLREDDLTHVAMAFDSVVSRVDRKDRSDSALIRSQFPIVADIARALGITIWPMSRYEADDAIATGAHRFGDEIDRTVICSNDNDFAQCIQADRIVRLNRITKETWNERDVIDRFGVAPQYIPEYLALVGDPSDGIPGIPGFGAKGTAALINRYGHLEDVPMEAADWDTDIRGKTKLGETLAERRNEAILYRNLSTLRTDVPLPDKLEDLVWAGASQDAINTIVTFMSSPDLLERTIRYT
jgi:5'-3' exonuclease